MFNPKRLTLARQRKRLTARSLAEQARLATDTIARLEKGQHEPDPNTINNIASVLGYPRNFFYMDDPEDLNSDSISFRSFSKMSAKERQAAEGAGQLALSLMDWVETRFSLPNVDIPDLNHESSPAIAAYLVRQAWGIGESAIGNLIGLLETHGIRVFSLSEDTSSVNAFSFWRDNKPFVFLNNFKTAESSIFDTAHELGHLVLHKQDNIRDIKNAEKEANAFASAFLMPENDIKSRIGYPITVDVILKAKLRWRVSAMALAYRLHTLGMLTPWQYKSICIELGRRGYRTDEPIGVRRETSTIWIKVLQSLWRNKISKHEIAQDLNWPLEELEGLIQFLEHKGKLSNESKNLSLVK
ncbi:helix-turn-helix domain-containing protein [Swingsia samuiensis]|uniref:ImmA/IrrE family metallo-endopeptidase n=1 Tax=Swingsia samuiensis TaxID=1293412 RepID=A0A4Y6UIF7_9PROT|nr:XRE family transcriptional regulator [Swingsia samuiensis]QDH17399.1 ImmA/IrrE family metallo-endopeptidase [Swingsia samuiensis]